MLHKQIAFVNGKIITIDPQDSIAEAVLVEGDRISAVGSNEEIREQLLPGGTVVDLGGRSVIPGLIDAHAHTALTINEQVNGVNVQQPYGPNCDTIEKILSKIKEQVAKTPKGEWVLAVASNVAVEKIKEGRLPTRDELDAISTEHPICFTMEVHVWVLNTYAINMLGYDLERRLGKNVTMGREPGGRPTGVYLEGWTQHSLTPWGYDKLLSAIRTGARERFTNHGITSVFELPYNGDEMRAWQQLYKEDDLPYRLRFYLTHPVMIDLDEFLRAGVGPDFGNDWMRIGGIKFFLDGIGLHANFQPYSDLKWEQEEIDELVEKAHKAGFQIWTHMATTPGIEQGLAAYTKALDKYPKPDARLRIEHSVEPRLDVGTDIPEDGIKQEYIDTMKKYGILPVGTPQFTHTFRFATRYRTLIHKHGFKLFYNSDSTGSQPEASNPWHGIWVLVSRMGWDGIPILPEEAVTPLEALRMATLWAAHSGFEENSKGSIEPGKLADIVVLADDPLTCETDALREMKTELVVIGGKEKYSSDAFKGALA
jgi:predicted amidohydrolase YtcJ